MSFSNIATGASEPMKNIRTYRALTTYGFSAMKALEIVVDARRGNRHALAWAKAALRATRSNA
jgi:hypothetical protein